MLTLPIQKKWQQIRKVGDKRIEKQQYKRPS